MQKRKDVDKRTIVLRIGTYRRLEEYKIKVINKRKDPQISFDDVVDSLLDEVR